MSSLIINKMSSNNRRTSSRLSTKRKATLNNESKNVSTKRTMRKQSTQTRQLTKRNKTIQSMHHVGSVTNPCENSSDEVFYEGTSKIVSINNIARGRADMFECIVIKNSYVDICFSNPKKSEESLYSLVKRDLSHSDAIKLGLAIEKIFCQMIETNPNLENIRSSKNIKGVQEKDHLFKSRTSNDVYYAEVKANLNLDTEKLPATIEKIHKITKELQAMYGKGIKVHPFLFTPRYVETKDIPSALSDKIKNEIDDYQKMIYDFHVDFNINHLVGINQYLSILGVKYQFKDEAQYKERLDYLAYRMFSCGVYDDAEFAALHEKSALSDDHTPSRSKAESRVFDVTGYPKVDQPPLEPINFGESES